MLEWFPFLLFLLLKIKSFLFLKLEKLNKTKRNKRKSYYLKRHMIFTMKTNESGWQVSD